MPSITHRSPTVVIALAGFTFTACDADFAGPDQIDSSIDDAGQPAAVAGNAAPGHRTPYVCYSATRIGDEAQPMWRHSRFWVRFPASMLEEAGSRTQPYRLRAVTADGDRWGTMNCVIPDALGATDVVDEVMGVGRIFKRREEDVEQHVSDVSYDGPCDPICVLPGITVTVPRGYGGLLFPDFAYQPDYIPDSGSDYDSYDPDPCDPVVDPTCEQPLTPLDVRTIRRAARYFNTRYTDQQRKEDCNKMKTEFERLMASGNVFRGATDTPHPNRHYAAYYAGRIHFDPWHLARAGRGLPADLKDLLNSMLHEAAHSLGYRHPQGYDPNGDYVDPPFDSLTPPKRQQPPGGDSCILY